MPNQLAGETSPYLLQHKDNPVDWHPWGERAFELAKCKDKPIFLSVGYSACHWCHVMAHESFEDPATAALMNELFINIKVDREERPDVDAIYMNAVQALTGRGGWPMSVWLLPDGRPFFGGTYYPAHPSGSMPSFKQVMRRVADLYRDKRDSVEDQATRLTAAISGRVLLESEHNVDPSAAVLETAYQGIAARYDSRWGGFSGQPKFPPSMTLELLLRMYDRFGWDDALTMTTHTLDRMAWGGMYDQVGGGFHRYSVDARWLVPHFEKMLYDNALLLRIYTHAYQVTHEPRYRRVVEETAAYLRREMTGPQGGFYSSQDAESEGKEGKFFVWRLEELHHVLGRGAAVDAVLDYWGVADGPNFEGHSILWAPEPPDVVAARHDMTPEALLAAVEDARARLFAVREARVHPGRDDKILAAWNGLAINSLAQAGRALADPTLTGMAVAAADFVLGQMCEDGRLYRSYKDGRAHLNGYLEDYAFMAEALIELYQTTFDLRWYREALALCEALVSRFWDDEAGFYDTAHDHESLITRPQEVTDNATPSGTSGALAALARMAALAGRADWREKVERVLARIGPAVAQYPTAFAYFGAQIDFVTRPPHEVAVVGAADDAGTANLLEALFHPYRPGQVVAFRAASDGAAAETIPLLAGRDPVDGRAAAYVCRQFTCRLPVTTAVDLAAELAR